MKRAILILAALTTLSACAGIGGYGYGDYYSLVRTRETRVGDGSMSVTPARPWNRQQRLFFDDVKWVEDWTLNGPLLDDLTFVSGLPDNKYLIRTESHDSQQIPRFHSDMTAPEINDEIINNFNLARGIRVFQTPAYIVGGHLVTGDSADINFAREVAKVKR